MNPLYVYDQGGIFLFLLGFGSGFGQTTLQGALVFMLFKDIPLSALYCEAAFSVLSHSSDDETRGSWLQGRHVLGTRHVSTRLSMSAGLALPSRPFFVEATSRVLSSAKGCHSLAFSPCVDRHISLGIARGISP